MRTHTHTVKYPLTHTFTHTDLQTSAHTHTHTYNHTHTYTNSHTHTLTHTQTPPPTCSTNHDPGSHSVFFLSLSLVFSPLLYFLDAPPFLSTFGNFLPQITRSEWLGYQPCGLDR